MAHIPGTSSVKLVMKYSSSHEASIWTHIRLLKNYSLHHLGALYEDPILVPKVNGALLIMLDHGHNLRDYAPHSAPVSPRIWALQLCDAVCFLHSHRIVHRDIKPDNITIDSDTQTLTLINFSAAEVVAEGESFKMGGGVGTKTWVNPTVRVWIETGRGDTYDAQKMDVWAVGRVLRLWLGTRQYVERVRRNSIRLRKFGRWLMVEQATVERDILKKLG